MFASRIIRLALLVAVTLSCTGCIGFSGPRDITRSLTRSSPIALEKEQAFNVGPVGVFLAQAFAGQYIPMKLDGLSSADFGTYTMTSTGHSAGLDFDVRALELEGWETIIRVRDDGGETIAVMVGTESKVRRMLFLKQEGDELMIARVKGNFDKIVDNLWESDLIDEDWMLGAMRGEDDADDGEDSGGDDGDVVIFVG